MTHSNKISQDVGDFDDETNPKLIYLFSKDDTQTQRLMLDLVKTKHEVRLFVELAELSAAVLIRSPSFIIIDKDWQSGDITNGILPPPIGAKYSVIYISSHDVFSQRLAAVRAGAVGYFIKPIDMEELIFKIDQIIAKNQISGYRVLVVEDDEMLGSYYEAVLNTAGMHVKSLSDPTNILDDMKEFRAELILTDINMPVCSGIELAKIIRQNNHYLRVPIVFITSDAEKQVTALDIGADDFLVKPIEPEALISTISNRVERYRCLLKEF